MANLHRGSLRLEEALQKDFVVSIRIENQVTPIHRR